MIFALLLCAFADSIPNFTALHDGTPTEALRTENIELTRDKGSITLKNGQLAFVKAGTDRPAIAVFTGDGVFRLKPLLPMDVRYLTKVSGSPDMEESFDSAVFYFTDSTYEEIKKQASAMPVDPRAAQVLKSLRDKVRIEGDVLGELYN